MDSCLANDNPLANFGDVTEVTLNAPSAVWTDGTRLLVADTENNRVLSGGPSRRRAATAADVVVGQADFPPPRRRA